MPLIRVLTSAPAPDDVGELLADLSSRLAGQLSKPESYVMTAFEGDSPMTFAGTAEPACYVEIKSIGTMSADQTRAMSADFCAVLGEALGVSPGRIYIEFADAERHMWGWDGRTFA